MCCQVSLSEGERRRKEGENTIFGTSSSVCRQRYVGVMVDVLDVKSLVEHDGEG